MDSTSKASAPSSTSTTLGSFSCIFPRSSFVQVSIYENIFPFATLKETYFFHITLNLGNCFMSAQIGAYHMLSNGAEPLHG